MGDFWIGAPNYSAASYIGFNAARDESEPTTAKWKLKDGAGAVVIASTLGGDLRFFSLPGEGIANPLPERALTDNTILNNEKMLIRADGKVGVGNPLSYPGNYNLYVTGGILTDKVKVAANGSLEWMDKVFDKSYLLRSLNEVELFIADNKHLPEIPSTVEVQKNGIDLAVMDSKLLQKIEELTLYMIQLNKQNSSLQKRIQLLEAE